MPVATLLLIAVTIVISLIGFSNPDLLRTYLLDVQAVLRHGEHARAVTSGFFHKDWQHLAFNMFSLFFFGGAVERVGGVPLLLAVYMSAIIGGSVLALFLHRKEEYFALGASGGVCGVIFAAIFFAPGMRILILPIPIPIPASVYAVIFIVGSAYAAKVKRDNVGHDAHLGGALVGLLAATLFNPAIVLSNPVLYGIVMVGGIAGVVYLARHSGSSDFGRW